MNGYTCKYCGGYFLENTSHYCIGERAERDQWDYTISIPFTGLETNLLLLQSDQKLLNKIIEMLSDYAGETGENEGAVDVLRRILKEHDQIKLQQEFAEGWRG